MDTSKVNTQSAAKATNVFSDLPLKIILQGKNSIRSQLTLCQPLAAWRRSAAAECMDRVTRRGAERKTRVFCRSAPPQVDKGLMVLVLVREIFLVWCFEQKAQSRQIQENAYIPMEARGRGGLGPLQGEQGGGAPNTNRK